MHSLLYAIVSKYSGQEMLKIMPHIQSRPMKCMDLERLGYITLSPILSHLKHIACVVL